MSKELTKDALIEIGTEEIPASYMPPALSFMKSHAEEALKLHFLPFESVITLGTPRRLALWITQVASKSQTRVEDVSGPSLKAAKDAQGNWTPAAKGFAQSQGVSLESLQIRSTPKGDYIFAVKKQGGIKAEKILAEIFQETLSAVPFPKKMVWNDSRFKFARPIRNLVTLYDGQVLRLNAAGIKSSNKTFGLSHVTPANIRVSSPQNYSGILKNHCVLADPELRQRTIVNAAEQLARKAGGQLKKDDDLVNEVTWLVEHPVAVLGRFDDHFLELPQEILITCMKKHQKFFSILDHKGKLMPCFIAIRNGISEHQDIVRKGYEKVLNARLTDAKFFFQEDLQKPLERFVEKCSGITLQQHLGSINDKIRRMQKIARSLTAELEQDGLEIPLDFQIIERAIQLSKFDLSTSMVYEYPELQGIAGSIYALRFNEKEKVARAIREHYYPITNQGDLPSRGECSVVALADKMESLVGNFLIGRSLSGSSDPYSLRRHSTGFLRILIENNWDLSVKKLIEDSAIVFSDNGLKAEPPILKNISDALMDRFQLLMQDSGFESDEIVSVTKNAADKDCQDFCAVTLKNKISALHAVRSHPDFEAVAAAYKRASNILKQARSKQIHFAVNEFKEELLKEESEKYLYKTIVNNFEVTRSLMERGKYEDVLREWVTFRTVLDGFFEKVMVMDPDSSLARNRLSLLAMFETLFKQIADFSLIQNK